ncbi:PaaI family thioesterase [Aliikangiella maris]|uniref:Hotdog fold thioesterase n=2 Tax=Aliikangiella maris TaxID=3162458 RepID=A0ABV3MKG4_9GAMM
MNDAVQNLLKNDPASRLLGIKIHSVDTGQCQLKMWVNESMTNGYQVCHGGFIFTFADTASAFASASQGEIVLSASNQIDYLAPAYLNDFLTAKAHVTSVCGKVIYCDVKVTNQSEKLLAVMNAKLVNKSLAANIKDNLEGFK